MKIYLKLPGGGELRLEREPMDTDRFQLVCLLIGIFLVGGWFLALLSILIGG